MRQSGCSVPIGVVITVGFFLFPAAAFFWNDLARWVESFNATPEEAAASKYVGGGPLDLREIERMVLELTNAERRRDGLEPLQHDPAITEIARQHSANMVRQGFGHELDGKDPTDRALATGYDCRAYSPDGSYTYGLSENIFEYPRVMEWKQWMGVTKVNEYRDDREMAVALVKDWMRSPSHRANILDSEARRIGVGLAVKEKLEHGYTTETVFATQNFSACR